MKEYLGVSEGKSGTTGVKTFLSMIEFYPVCFARPGTHLTAYAALITFRQLLI